MDSRKLQKTGGSTMIVSLPKKWIDDSNLNQGSEVRIIPQPNGTLLIDAASSGKPRDKSISIDITDQKDDHIFRELIGAYLVGYVEIVIKGKPRLSVTNRKIVRKFSASVIGVEIIEEEGNQMILNDVSSPGALSFRRAVKRLYRIVRAMFNDSILILEGNEELSMDVIDRDKEANKLNWFIGRQLNTMFEDLQLVEKLSSSLSDANFYGHVSRSLERIGDHACRIAEVGYLAGKVSDSTMVSLAKEASQVMEDSMVCFLNVKPVKATQSIDKGKQMVTKIQKYYTTKHQNPIEHPLEFSTAMDAIMRTVAYSTDIAEATINFAAQSNNDK